MALRFVVHEHHATRLHFDFRLEMEGVLRSWAIPKGPSMNPAEKRLAIAVEDHLLEYIDYEGIIPGGEYGSGAVVIWDSGTFELIEENEDKISFTIEGKKLKGDYTLARLKKSKKGNEWLLIKKRDAFAQPQWKLENALTPEKRAELKEIPQPCQTSRV